MLFKVISWEVSEIATMHKFLILLLKTTPLYESGSNREQCQNTQQLRAWISNPHRRLNRRLHLQLQTCTVPYYSRHFRGSERVPRGQRVSPALSQNKNTQKDAECLRRWSDFAADMISFQTTHTHVFEKQSTLKIMSMYLEGFFRSCNTIFQGAKSSFQFVRHVHL